LQAKNNMNAQGKNLFGKLNGYFLSQRFGLRAVSFLDQLLFSVGNFLLTLTFARYYSDTEVAGFGIALSVALMIQGAQRTWYIVQNSVLPPSLFCHRTAKTLGHHLIVMGLLLAVEGVIGGALLALFWSPLVLAAVCSVFTLTLIYAHLDFERIAFLKHKKYLDPLIASAAFFGLTGALFFAVPEWQIGFLTSLALVSFYAVLKIARLVFLTARPDFVRGWGMTRSSLRKHLGPALLGITGATGYTHVPLFVLNSVAAPIHGAAFTALRSLMQPLNIVIRSLDVIDKNVFQAGGGADLAALRKVFLRQFALYGGISAATILATPFLGEPLLHLLYGDKYGAFADTLIYWAVIFACMTVTLPIETVIVKRGLLKAYNLWRLAAGGVGAVLAVVLCAPFGLTGAVIAYMSGWVSSVLLALWIIRDVLFSAKAGSAD
jgi:O-antigen/teichoic acid export membrane protein